MHIELTCASTNRHRGTCISFIYPSSLRLQYQFIFGNMKCQVTINGTFEHFMQHNNLRSFKTLHKCIAFNELIK